MLAVSTCSENWTETSDYSRSWNLLRKKQCECEAHCSSLWTSRNKNQPIFISIFDIRYTNLHCGIFPSRKKDRHDTSLKRRRDPAWEHRQVRYDIPKSLVVYARRETCDSTCVPIVYTLFFIRVILSRFSRITLQLFKGFIGLSFVSLSYPTQLFSLEKNTSPP